MRVRQPLLASVAAMACSACGPVVVAAVGVQDDLSNAARRARDRGTFAEAKLALSSLASSEQAYFRRARAWVVFPLSPDAVPATPLKLPPRPEWTALDWAPPSPTRFAYRAEVVPGAPEPEVLLHVEGVEGGTPVVFEVHVTEGSMHW